MKKDRSFKIINAYIKRHRMGCLAFVLEIAIYITVFYLYGLDTEAVWYATALILFPLFFLVLPGFLTFSSRHRALQRLLEGNFLSTDRLPKASDLVEEDYQALIWQLCQERRKIQTKAEKDYLDTVDFYTLWAHQIKTPIAAMSLLLQAEETEHKSELRQQLFKIERYAEIVLGYLRMEGLHNDLQIETCNLEGMVKQAVKKYSSVFVYQKLQLHMVNLNVPVLTDEKWTVFVLEQLISNALKYTKEGGITVSAYTSCLKNGDTLTVLSIEDTGIGIQKEDLPRIFEKGFTGYNGRVDKKASGLGLYLCKKILGQLSHKIEIESEPDQGTKVRILFQRAGHVME